ncbi:capsular polysaccharide biosynthesis protein [Enterovirga rhinocerotis]|uniref:Capsular polysaccharide biosynthesis protein n=2 Tax=Enterovirga rhinocerotis TaxID=1339210 RepID=A0A4R7BTC0_9HYPH|nr:capsular polysaccharide biosynthesis protein [Enterovirga rhinocerotis]
MNLAKRKGLIARTPESERPPAGPLRFPPRLASEPVSRFRPFEDRWEPGFLRLPLASASRPLSWVVDSMGIYYDATAPSELEMLLERGGWESDELMAEAEAGIAALRQSGLSLDNDPRRRDLGRLLDAAEDLDLGPGGKVVVVVDQPIADQTVGFSLAGAGRFGAMLEYARAENPDAMIVVVTDPAGPAVAEAGHLLRRPLPEGVFPVYEPVTSRSIIDRADRLYTVCTHLGFEAALAGIPVVCFGIAFYSGWGFTDDRLVASRRTRRRSALEVFAAAYLHYSRYYDPKTGGMIGFADALALLKDEVAASRTATTARSRNRGSIGLERLGIFRSGLRHLLPKN